MIHITKLKVASKAPEPRGQSAAPISLTLTPAAEQLPRHQGKKKGGTPKAEDSDTDPEAPVAHQMLSFIMDDPDFESEASDTPKIVKVNRTDLLLQQIHSVHGSFYCRKSWAFNVIIGFESGVCQSGEHYYYYYTLANTKETLIELLSHQNLYFSLPFLGVRSQHFLMWWFFPGFISTQRWASVRPLRRWLAVSQGARTSEAHCDLLQTQGRYRPVWPRHPRRGSGSQG